MFLKKKKIYIYNNNSIQIYWYVSILIFYKVKKWRGKAKKRPRDLSWWRFEKPSASCLFGKDYFCQLILLFSLFLLLFMSPVTLFDTIQGFYGTISTNFYLYLQYFQQKKFIFNKIGGFQTDSQLAVNKTKTRRIQRQRRKGRIIRIYIDGWFNNGGAARMISCMMRGGGGGRECCGFGFACTF